MSEFDERQMGQRLSELQMLQIIDALEKIEKSLNRLATFLEAIRTREETKENSHGS